MKTLHFTFAALSLVFHADVMSHDCGTSPIRLHPGELTAYVIRSDVAENQPSLYNLSINSDPAVATVSPDHFSSFGWGVFVIRARKAGTNKVVLEWSYPPRSAGGFCVVDVIVSEKPSDPRDAADESTSGEMDGSGKANDPVDTYTGEYVVTEDIDLDLGGVMPVRFTRYYASGLQRRPRPPGNLGGNWMHNYDLRLLRDATEVDVFYYEGRVLHFTFKDGAWNQTGGSGIPYRLREGNGGFALLDPQRNWVFSFNGDGRLVSIEDTRGNALSLEYQVGQLSRVTDGKGRTLSFTYIGEQELDSVSDGSRTVRFIQGGGRLAEVIREVAGGVSEVTRYQYSGAPGGGWMTARTLPDGNTPTTQAYDAKGRVVRQTRADGGVWTFAYAGLETTIVNPEGKAQKHLHDGGGHLVQVTEETGRKVTSQYNAQGRRIGETRRSGDVTNWDYHPESGGLASVTMPGPLAIAFERKARSFKGFTLYDVSKITYLDQATEQFAYDEKGNMVAFTDRAGRRSTYAYNAQGRMVAATNNAGGVMRFQYNPDGTRSSMTRSIAGQPEETTLYSYDVLKRLIQVRHPDGATSSVVLDTWDRPVKSVDEEGKASLYSYTLNGLLKKVTRPDGSNLTHSYNAMNDLVAVTDDLGRSVTRTYDSMGRLRSVTDRNGNTQRLEYDALGQVVGFVDGEGKRWEREYDAEGRLATLINPAGDEQAFHVNGLNRVTGIDMAGEQFQFRYDPMGRPRQMQSPAGDATALTYFPDGALQSVTLPGGISADYTLDRLGIRSVITDPNGNDWLFLHDALGRETGRVDPLQRTNRLILDSQGRVARSVLPGGLGQTDFIYNRRGQVTRQVSSDGLSLDYAYDNNGRIVSATGLSLAYNTTDELTDSNGIQISRDAGGRIVAINLAPGKSIAYAYDRRNQVTNVTDWTGAKTALEYDTVGRLIRMVRPNAVETRYSYDPVGRLRSIRESRGASLASIELVRDAHGWVVRADRNLPLPPTAQPTPKARTYDAACQMVGAGYDALGRLLSDGARRYAWNGASRLVEFTDGVTKATFTYDAFGSLLTRNGASGRREFVWNYALGLRSPQIIRDAGMDSMYAVHLPGGDLLYTIEAVSGGHHFHHFDEVGNTVFMTGDDGTITDAYAYSPYGVLSRRTGGTDNPFAWGGRYSVLSWPGEDLAYMRHRWYDARNGRFLSRDPNWAHSMNPNELNPYGLARANPLRYVDPLGLDARVNQNGVHTDISVDIWEGDQVVGSLTVSYAAKGYKGSFGGWSEAFWTVIGGTQGQFSIDYKRGSVSASASSSALRQGTQVVIHGTREQDERLRKALSGIIGTTDEYANESRGESIIRQFIYQSRFKKSQQMLIDATIDDWQTYRAASQSCNDFTDAMLDIYYGENWYFGPIFEGGGLMEELKAYEKRRISPMDDGTGIARITGATVVR